MKRSFVFQDGNSQKFWIIEYKGDSFTVNYGRLATEGQYLTKKFDTNDKCRVEFEKLIKEKLKKGYKELPEGEKMPEPSVSKQKSDEFPIPTHLRKIFIPTDDKNNEFKVIGIIRCSCGSECFQLKLIASEIKNELPMNGETLIMKSICNKCKKGYIIFDNNKHGWNGFIEGGDNDTVPDKELKEWNCPKCGNCGYNIKVSIQSNGKQDFIEESGIADGDDEFKKSDWVNAFSSITINLKCINCGHDNGDMLDYETM